MFTVLVNAIYLFSELLTTVMLIQVFLSWIPHNSYGMLGKFNALCEKITDPVVVPCRQLLSRFNTGIFDFSILLAFFLVQFAAALIVRILYMIV